MSPDKCVLLSTSKSVRKATKLWDISGDGRFWKVQLDGRDLCGQLDFTRSTRAGTLLNGLGRLQLVLLLLVLCLLGFRSSLAWLEVGIFLLVFMLLKLLLSPPLRLVSPLRFLVVSVSMQTPAPLGPRLLPKPCPFHHLR